MAGAVLQHLGLGGGLWRALIFMAGGMARETWEKYNAKSSFLALRSAYFSCETHLDGLCDVNLDVQILWQAPRFGDR